MLLVDGSNFRLQVFGSDLFRLLIVACEVSSFAAIVSPCGARARSEGLLHAVQFQDLWASDLVHVEPQRHRVLRLVEVWLFKLVSVAVTVSLARQEHRLSCAQTGQARIVHSQLRTTVTPHVHT